VKLLDELVSPMPIFVRPMVKMKVKSTIMDGFKGDVVTKDDVVRGYILASPGDMQARAIKLLKSKGIDLSPYESLLNQGK
jgi:hypothetical protein